MEQLFPILIGALIFGYQTYANYKKEQEKAKKRDFGRPMPDNTIPMEVEILDPVQERAKRRASMEQDPKRFETQRSETKRFDTQRPQTKRFDTQRSETKRFDTQRPETRDFDTQRPQTKRRDAEWPIKEWLETLENPEKTLRRAAPQKDSSKNESPQKDLAHYAEKRKAEMSHERLAEQYKKMTVPSVKKEASQKWQAPQVSSSIQQLEVLELQEDGNFQGKAMQIDLREAVLHAAILERKF